MYKLVYTKQAKKDAKKIKGSNLKAEVENLLKIIEKTPYKESPPFHRLVGDLKGAISRRINIQHRLVYQVLKKEKIIKIIRMWTHYD